MSFSSYPPPGSRLPPRPNRSRSPLGYPGPEPNRGEWDGYDRSRAWADYEREKAVYDYGRRGRSRSPGVDDGRKRRRSASPYGNDRYDPRPRYGDEYDQPRGHGYNSSRRGDRRAPQDPHTLDYSASLKQYADWFRYYYPQQATEEDNADKAAELEAGDGSKPRNGIKSKWETYKKEFSRTQLQSLFDHHRKSPWFAEKYDPSWDFENLRKRIRKEGWKGRIDTFLQELEAGTFDPESQPDASVADVKDEDKAMDTSSVPAGTAEQSTDDVKVEEDQFNVETEEEQGDTDGNRLEVSEKSNNGSTRQAGPNRGEEISVMPEGNQVMIRTIPPDIGRLRIEQACCRTDGYTYLALGDPLQKRNYYRAGWIKFSDAADMAQVMSELSEKKIEGFKLHVTHNTRPFVNRVRYAPEVSSMPHRLQKDLVNAKKLAVLLEEQNETLRKTKLESLVPQLPTTTSADKTADAAKPEDEERPADESADIDADEVDDGPRESGCDACERRIEKIMADLVEKGTVDANSEKEYEAKKTLVSLDIYLAYLRSAFHACYYCAIITDHLEELQRKCLQHLRKPMTKSMIEEVKAAEEAERERVREAEGQQAKSEEDIDVDMDKDKVVEKVVKEKMSNEARDWKRNDERWLEWLDSKMALLTDRESVDPREYGGKNYDDELTKAVEEHIKQEDEGKFRCKTCMKLFKATSFVEKHIANKHAHLVKELDDIPYFNNFALDPHRIQPNSASMGNHNQGSGQAYGQYNGQAGGDYGRHNGGGGYGQGHPPPPYNNNGPGGFHDSYSGGYNSGGGGRLSDRIGGFDPMSMPLSAGLPAKPQGGAMLEPGPGRNHRRTGPLPPPPADAKEDPRAQGGKRVSYHDMDSVAEGDVELSY